MDEEKQQELEALRRAQTRVQKDAVLGVLRTCELFLRKRWRDVLVWVVVIPLGGYGLHELWKGYDTHRLGVRMAADARRELASLPPVARSTPGRSRESRRESPALMAIDRLMQETDEATAREKGAKLREKGLLWSPAMHKMEVKNLRWEREWARQKREEEMEARIEARRTSLRWQANWNAQPSRTRIMNGVGGLVVTFVLLVLGTLWLRKHGSRVVAADDAEDEIEVGPKTASQEGPKIDKSSQ